MPARRVTDDLVSEALSSDAWASWKVSLQITAWTCGGAITAGIAAYAANLVAAGIIVALAAGGLLSLPVGLAVFEIQRLGRARRALEYLSTDQHQYDVLLADARARRDQALAESRGLQERLALAEARNAMLAEMLENVRRLYPTETREEE